MGLGRVASLLNNCGRLLILLILFINFTSIAFAQQELADALSQLCTTATTFLAGSIVVLIVLSAVVYAIGQIMVQKQGQGHQFGQHQCSQVLS